MSRGTDADCVVRQPQGAAKEDMERVIGIDPTLVVWDRRKQWPLA